MKQVNKGDSSATLTLKEYYDVAILFAQSIPHPKTVALKLFYTASDQSSDRGDGPEKKGGKGKGDRGIANNNDNSGRGKEVNTLDGTPTSVCLYHVWNSTGCNRLNPHCKQASADICHPANRRGTGVLHAENLGEVAGMHFQGMFVLVRPSCDSKGQMHTCIQARDGRRTDRQP